MLYSFANVACPHPPNTGVRGRPSVVGLARLRDDLLPAALRKTHADISANVVVRRADTRRPSGAPFAKMYAWPLPSRAKSGIGDHDLTLPRNPTPEVPGSARCAWRFGADAAP